MNGKAKEAFKKFCQENDYSLFSESEKYKDLAIMNNALIIEWLDSVGIVISVMVDMSFNHNIYYDYTLTVNSFTYFSNETYKSRQEATEAAIKKAVEIFNSKYENNGTTN
ncbi:hypothetical protein [Elizabethkingia anophelis]|uniref:hypothetical protein n=1 Tax=Elizabethkingia anophelis TaxID=1117645 RepID=UPI003786FE3D